MKKLLLLCLSTLGFTTLLQAQTDAINIKTTGLLVDYEGNTTIDASALLQLNSDAIATQGFLAPRVLLTATNTAGPITNPATGLLVYNTNTAGTAPNNVIEGFYYNAGTSGTPNWVRLVTGGTANAWTLAGNTGTAPSTSAIGVAANNNFIGTTDVKDFVLSTSGFERMRIASGGNVGIGNTSPVNLLDIASAARTGTHTTGAFIRYQYFFASRSRS